MPRRSLVPALFRRCVLIVSSSSEIRPGEAPVVAKSGAGRERSYTASESSSRVFLSVFGRVECAGGLVVTAYLAPIATSYHISTSSFPDRSTLSVALVFANVMNGVARPLFAWCLTTSSLADMSIASLSPASYFCSIVGRSSHGIVFFTGMYSSAGQTYSVCSVHVYRLSERNTPP